MSGMQNDHIFRLLTKLCYWRPVEPAFGLSVAPGPVEISIGQNRPHSKIFFPREVHRHVLCPNPRRWSSILFQTLFFNQGHAREMHQKSNPKLFCSHVNLVFLCGAMCLMYAYWLHWSPFLWLHRIHLFLGDILI